MSRTLFYKEFYSKPTILDEVVPLDLVQDDDCAYRFTPIFHTAFPYSWSEDDCVNES